VREYRRLVLCYGAFGFGYIIPATFLPAMAKKIIPDPQLFGGLACVRRRRGGLDGLRGAVEAGPVSPGRLDRRSSRHGDRKS